MKKTLTLIGLLTILAQLPGGVEAQDIHFSQFYEAQLYENPALSGLYKGDVHVVAMFRQQWTSVADPYETGYLSGEYKIPVGKQNDYLTLGTQLMYDQAGTATLTTTLIEPSINYSKSLNNTRDMFLSVGFMGGLTQRRIDQSKMTTDYQYDNGGTGFDGETIPNPNVAYMDGSAGVSFTTALGAENRNHFYVGASYDHFNKPKASFYDNGAVELDPKWVFSAGIKLYVTDQTSVEFHADHMQQGPYNETMAGGIISYKFRDSDDPDYVLGLGAFVRWQSDIVPVVRLDYRLFAVSLSYDANISQLTVASQGRGGFELGVSFLAFTRLDNSTRNSTLCPVF